MEKAISESIIKTLSYFDIFYCPVTPEELYFNLLQPEKISYQNFKTELSKYLETTETKIVMENGYIFLKENTESIEQRIRRVWYVEQKLKRAKKAAQLIKFLPFVKAFFVCNQIETGVTQKSDIDVLILVTPGRMFFARFIVTLLLHVFRLRRHGKKITDRICLSFYLTTDNLDFSQLRGGGSDIYLTYWMTQLIPIYDPDNYLQTIDEKNKWVRDLIPNSISEQKFLKRIITKEGKIAHTVKNGLEKILKGKIGDKVELFFRNLQTKYMAKNNNGQKSGNGVVISDSILKFHENDRRELFREEWEKRWKKFLEIRN